MEPARSHALSKAEGVAQGWQSLRQAGEVVYSSRMRHNIQNHDGLFPAGVIEPENSISPWRVLLGVGLEYLLAAGTLETLKWFTLQAIVPGIGLEEM